MRKDMCLLLVVAVLGINGYADEVFVGSLGRNGELVWDSVTNGEYSVEWAPQLEGRWSDGPIPMVVATGTSAQVSVPMYYRVEWLNPPDVLPEGQKYAFEIWYENYAWGFQSHGLSIDRHGFVTASDISGLQQRIHPIDGVYTEAQLDLKFGTQSERVAQIDPLIFEDMVGLIERAKGPGPRASVSGPIDAGEIHYKAFVYDANAGEYECIDLSSHGCFSCTHARMTLMKWLKSIGDAHGVSLPSLPYL